MDTRDLSLGYRPRNSKVENKHSESHTAKRVNHGQRVLRWLGTIYLYE